MLLKRDTVCEVCGHMTRRGKARLIAAIIPVVIVLIGFVFIFHVIGGFAPH
jgi:uncharacterized protein (DUF983 family)